MLFLLSSQHHRSTEGSLPKKQKKNRRAIVHLDSPGKRSLIWNAVASSHSLYFGYQVVWVPQELTSTARSCTVGLSVMQAWILVYQRFGIRVWPLWRSSLSNGSRTDEMQRVLWHGWLDDRKGIKNCSVYLQVFFWGYGPTSSNSRKNN